MKILFQTKPNENEREYSVHLSKQLESLWKHLEYHDSNIFKIISIYFAAAGLFIARIQLFSEHVYLTLVLVMIVGILFYKMLKRISELLNELKKKIVEIDYEKNTLHGYKFCSIPKMYIEGKNRTSILSYRAIIILTFLISLYLLNLEHQFI